MHSKPRIYLDHAATSWPKPDSVYQAVDRTLREVGAAAGRGVYTEALAADRLVQQARAAVAQCLNASEPRRVVFAANGTDALHLALAGVLNVGGHVVTTVVEHNSVLRPLHWLGRQGRITTSIVGCDSSGVVDLDALRAALRVDTRLVVLNQASNVTGAIQPVAEAAGLAHEVGALLLVDAAQSLGELLLDVQQLEVDLLAAPGHKGLLGPLGTGVLYVRPGVERWVEPIRAGGTGSQSESAEQPAHLPDKYESGNLNVPALAGLAAGAQWTLDRGLPVRRAHAQQLTERLLTGLRELPGVEVLGPAEARARVGVVSVRVLDWAPQDLAALLDAQWKIQVRAGLHCAPRMHAALGTLATGGTLRFSVGAFSTEAEIDAALRALGEILSPG